MTYETKKLKSQSVHYNICSISAALWSIVFCGTYNHNVKNFKKAKKFFVVTAISLKYLEQLTISLSIF